MLSHFLPNNHSPVGLHDSQVALFAADLADASRVLLGEARVEPGLWEQHQQGSGSEGLWWYSGGDRWWWWW